MNVWIYGILLGVLLWLAASGIYALMSFSVTERTREIGIRTALGARRSTIAFTIAKRSLAQIGTGVLLGTPMAVLIFVEVRGEGAMGLIPIDSPLLLTLIVGASVMVLIGVPACTVPTLRALRIMATVALREGG